jgi:hypothetical protein
VLNTTVTILSPLVEWYADNLPDRALGGHSAFLFLIGSARLRVCEPLGIDAILESGFKMTILV